MRSTPNYITTATTTTVRTGTGVLNNVVITGGTLGDITIYNNIEASGDIIAKFDSSAARNSYHFESVFGIGCTVVTSAATQCTINVSP